MRSLKPARESMAHRLNLESVRTRMFFPPKYQTHTRSVHDRRSLWPEAMLVATAAQPGGRECLASALGLSVIPKPGPVGTLSNPSASEQAPKRAR